MAARREMRFADPVGALAAHLGEALGGAVHEQRHEMAADAGVGARALRHDRSSGCAGSRSRNRACAPPPRLSSASAARVALIARQRRRERRDRANASTSRSPIATAIVWRIERALGWATAIRPLSSRLADDDGLMGDAVEHFAQLRLDQRALLLDDDDRDRARRRRPAALRLDRPDAAELEECAGRARRSAPRRGRARRAPGARRDRICRR